MKDADGDRAAPRRRDSLAILRRSGDEVAFRAGDRFSHDILRGDSIGNVWKPHAVETKSPETVSDKSEGSFWHRIHALEASFRSGHESRNPQQATNALLELDRTIWQAQQDLEPEEFISQARETLRDLMVLLGTQLAGSPPCKQECLTPLVEALLKLRRQFRQKKQWQDADAIRDRLQQSGILVEDTADGPRWRLGS